MLQMLPKGTNDYAKFVKPSELASFARQANLTLQDQAGMSYNPITKNYALNKDVSVNYLVHTVKAAD